MPSRRRRTGACAWRDTAFEHSPVFTRMALPGSMLFQRHAGASRNQRAFRLYFALIRSCHTAGKRTYVRLLADGDSCIFCDKEHTPDCDWESQNRRRGGPVFFFHGEQEVRAVLAGRDSFDTVTDNVQKRAAKDPQFLAHGAFMVEIERSGRDPIHTCDECKHILPWMPAVTEDYMQAENTHTLQLLRNFWERGVYADVCSVVA